MHVLSLSHPPLFVQHGFAGGLVTAAEFTVFVFNALHPNTSAFLVYQISFEILSKLEGDMKLKLPTGFSLTH